MQMHSIYNHCLLCSYHSNGYGIFKVYPFDLISVGLHPSIWNYNSEWRRIRGGGQGLATLRPHVNHLMGVYIDWMMVCKENELQGISIGSVVVGWQYHQSVQFFMALELLSVWGPKFEQISKEERGPSLLHTSIHLRVFCWLLRISHHTKREVHTMATCGFSYGHHVIFHECKRWLCVNH